MNTVIEIHESEIKNMLYNSVVNAIQNNLGYLLRHPNEDIYNSLGYENAAPSTGGVQRPEVTFAFDKDAKGHLIATLTIINNVDA